MAETLDRKPFERTMEALKTEQSTWLGGWKDIVKYEAPQRGHFDNQQPNQGKIIDHKTLLDGRAVRAGETLSAGMSSGLTNPSSQWFKLGLADKKLEKREGVKSYLEECRERMMAVFDRSNFYGALDSIYEECGHFATAAMLVVEDFRDVIRCRPYTIGEFVLAVGADGRVNTFGTDYQFTVGQLVGAFGKDAVSAPVRGMYDKGDLQNWVKCRHLIEENDQRLPGRADFRNMPYRSVYWEDGSKEGKFLRVHGFEEFPAMCPRWRQRTTRDAYGFGSPGYLALGDAKMLQAIQRDKLIALKKMGDPPLNADASVKRGGVNTLPGGVSRSNSSAPNAGVRAAYQVQPHMEQIEFSVAKTQEAIDRYYYVDLFLMLQRADRTNMTAREVAERHEEKLLMLGNVIERLESELLDPAIQRTYSIMNRVGLLPPPPEELQGQELKVEYISILAQAQKMVRVTALREHVTVVAGWEAVKPGTIDNLDLDKASELHADMLGIPPGVNRSPEALAEIREARAKAAEQQAMADAAERAANGAKVLADTPLNTGSALDALMGGAGGGGTA